MFPALRTDAARVTTQAAIPPHSGFSGRRRAWAQDFPDLTTMFDGDRRCVHGHRTSLHIRTTSNRQNIRAWRRRMKKVPWHFHGRARVSGKACAQGSHEP